MKGLKQYYSSGEEVLRHAEEGDIFSLVNLFSDGWPDPAPNAWTLQEKAKGMNTIAGLFAGTPSGGWGFNLEYSEKKNPITGEVVYIKMLPADALQLSDDQLKEQPFFTPFINDDLFGTDGGSEAFVESYVHELAYGIPALSFAAGSTALIDESVNKLDMQLLRLNNEIAGRWPTERDQDNNWRHSDFKDVAYLYVYGLFDDVVETADLR